LAKRWKEVSTSPMIKPLLLQKLKVSPMKCKDSNRNMSRAIILSVRIKKNPHGNSMSSRTMKTSLIKSIK
jgi:hypothetical protein